MDDDMGWFFFGIIALIIWGTGSFFGWWGKSDIDKLREALQSANNQIEECDSQIHNAKNDVWQDYQTMANALESLSGCYTISDPTKK